MDFTYDLGSVTLSSELSYGIFTRLLGMVYIVCFWAFAVQLPTLAGKHGLEPLGQSLATKRRHFGLWAYWYYPTLFWLFNTEALLDTMLWVLPTLGCVCGGLVVYGGASTPYLLGACWVILLAIDAGPTLLVYPWDSLLLEVGFLSLWLPGTVAFSGGLASLAALHAPSPLHSFAFRWLAFRVLVGFGKLKFVGSEWRDRLYIRGFLINQPMVSPLGWWAHHALPEWVWVASLGGMFVVEMVAPFGFFFTGALRVMASASIAGLMVGIWATGNYGYFNVLTMALCMGAVDQGVSASLSFTSADLVPPGSGPLFLSAAASSASSGEVLSFLQHYLHLSPTTLVTQWPSLLLSTLLLTYILPLSTILFVMNSWINMSWAFWGGVYRLRVHPALGWTQAYAGLLRSLMQFRVVAAYGVFPPHTSPSQRWALVYEGSQDGVVFHRYEYKHYLSSPTTPPAFIAPFHPRLDHAIFYESFGSAGTPIAALGHNNPYAYHTSCNAWKSLQVKLLLGGKDGAGMAPFFSHNPFPDPAKPPTYVRIQAYQYTPHTPAHAAATGEYWKERSIGTQYECLSLNDLRAASAGSSVGAAATSSSSSPPLWPLSDVAPEPEEFWCEFEEWRKRARVASRGVTKQEYEEAWEFLGELRALAAEEGLALCSKARKGGKREGDGEGGGEGGRSRAPSAGRQGPTGGGESRRRKGASPSAATAAAAAASKAAVVEGGGGGREAAGADAASPPSMARLCAETYVREPSDKSALEKAALEVQKACTSSSSSSSSSTSSLGPLSPATAATLFTWEVLPGTVTRVRERYTMAQLVALRGTLNRLVIPLLRGAQRVFDRVAPTEEELVAEWAAEGGGESTAAVPEGMHEMMGRSPPAPPTLPNTSSSPLPTLSLRFRGNDDASPQGAMSSSLRWLQHAHRVMLVGGRRAYEASAGGLLGWAVGSSTLTEPLELWSDKDHLGTLPRPTAYQHLCGGGRGGGGGGGGGVFSPATMTTELSTFLFFTLTYDSLNTMAVNHARVAAQSRPTPPSVLPHFLPAILALTPRIQAHPALRIPIPGARGRGEKRGKGGAGVVGEAAILPLWGLSQDGASWHQLEHY